MPISESHPSVLAELADLLASIRISDIPEPSDALEPHFEVIGIADETIKMHWELERILSARIDALKSRLDGDEPVEEGFLTEVGRAIGLHSSAVSVTLTELSSRFPKMWDRESYGICCGWRIYIFDSTPKKRRRQTFH